MSANKFKVGDKVRVREGLVTDKYYDNVYIGTDIAKPGSEVSTVVFAGKDIYKLEGGNNSWWKGGMLELIEKTMHDLCAGDLIKAGGDVRKVLAALDGCYLLSYIERYDTADGWYTVKELEAKGFEFFDPQVKPIEIDGKMYDEAEVKKAIKDLEPIR